MTEIVEMKILETERLYLREMETDDAENAYRLNLDWENIKYTGDKPFESIQEAKEFLLNYSHYKNYGFGRWAVIEKYSNEFLGWCGLKYTPELDEYGSDPRVDFVWSVGGDDKINSSSWILDKYYEERESICR